ncbi:hypothetical protein E2C01_013415 [Portunus trituberculatus]|uniref:Uncharacterized protein n=1 Tax=Portunus trituberculatus TaxID=210409 RepID=A0A5B7DG70_PORTR|nr:hypothetical protein [Portunus trituberculatus]
MSPCDKRAAAGRSRPRCSPAPPHAADGARELLVQVHSVDSEPLARWPVTGGLPELQFFLVVLILKSSLGASVRGGPALKVVQVSGLVRSVHSLEGDSPGLRGGGGSLPTQGSERSAANEDQPQHTRHAPESMSSVEYFAS